MYKTILLLTALAAPAFAQPELPLPLLYTVTGVAANDTLNVREAPDAAAHDIGDLQPGETVEVLEISDDGKWGMVSSGENIGWVATRFLSLTPNTMGDGFDLPYGMPKRLACSGTEPFWSAEIITGASFSFTDYSADDFTPKYYPMLGATKPINRGIEDYGFISPPFTGILSREICDDGMSGRLYGWSVQLLRMNEGGAGMLSGCCSAQLP